MTKPTPPKHEKPKLKRFYKTATLGASNTAWQVLLDGKPMRTPQKAVFEVPQKALAEAVVEEWASQGSEIALEQMPLTQFTCAVLDYTTRFRHDVESETAAYATTDLLCYRAAEPEALVQRQKDAWDKWLDWAQTRYDIRMVLTTGIMPVEQEPASLEALEKEITALDDYGLTAVWLMAKHCSSLLLPLAVWEKQLDAETAYRIARVDEIYQSEQWGADEEALERRESGAREMFAIGEFVKLIQ